MRTMLSVLLVVGSVVLVGCNEQDSNIHLREGVKSDSLLDNVVTRPVANAFSALIGEGIEIKEAIMIRNKDGFMELNVNGFNRSSSVRKFRYRVEWLDTNGIVLQNRTSVWQRASAMGKSPFAIRAVAPRTEAVNFRMDTRKWE